VRRGGEVVTINEENLLVGDILILNSGDDIPADGIIIQEYTS
jgi:magnesium-transporting ATPase (P-type)